MVQCAEEGGWEDHPTHPQYPFYQTARSTRSTPRPQVPQATPIKYRSRSLRRHMPIRRAPAALLLLAILAAPTTAVDVHIPEHVAGNNVPVQVEAIAPGDTIAFYLNGNARTLQGQGTTRTDTLENLEPGRHTWVLTITRGNNITTHSGEIYVEHLLGPMHAAVQELHAAIATANLNAAQAANAVATARGDANTTLASLDTLLNTLARQLEALNTTNHHRLASLEERQNTTQTTLSGLQGLSTKTTEDLDTLHVLQDTGTTAAQRAGTWSAVGATVAIVGALTLLAATTILWLHARTRHREAMALLLAFAAKNGITPDSEEFRAALAALDTQ